MPISRKMAAGLLLLAAGLFGWHEFHAAAPRSYQTAAVERGDVRSTVTADGTVTALVTVQVGSQVSGNVKTLYADFNTVVRKGQLLAEIDPAPFAAKVDQAKSALEGANAAVLTARAQGAKAQADIQSAQAQESNQRASLERTRSVESDADLKLAARKGLGSVVAPEDLETAQTTHDEAVADREAAEAELRAADAVIVSDRSQYDSAMAQVDEAIDQVHQAEGALAQAQVDLDHTRITSPIDGVVISRDIDAGQTVAASVSAPTLFEIAQDLSQLEVDVNVDESDVSRLKIGQDGTFTVDALPGVTFAAVVKQIRRAPINVQNVITYDVIMSVTHPDAELFPGMTASIRVFADIHRNVLKVNNAALGYLPANVSKPAGKDTKTVYVLDAAHQVTPRTVATGLSDGSSTEIVSGDLHEGDLVILSDRPASRS